MKRKKRLPSKQPVRLLSRRDFIKTGTLSAVAATLNVPVASRSRLKRSTSVVGTKPQIMVIGAGAFGGWTALHLLRKGADVTLVDAWGPGNSRASSGGETRVIRGIYGPDRIYVQLVSRSFDLWRENEHRWRTRLYRKTGTLWMFSAEDTYAQNSMPLQREFGMKVDKITPSEAQARYPQINLKGIRTLYYEHEAGYLYARHACRVVRDAFVREGGSYRRAAVRPGSLKSGALSHVRFSDNSTLFADQYVFACGPWLGRLFPDVIGHRVQPSRQEVYYFGTPAGDDSYTETKLPIWVEFGEKLFYGIPGAAGRGFKVADDTRGPEFDPTEGERTPSAEGIHAMRQFLATRFPKLTDAPLLEARVCQYENSPDGHLIVDRHPEAGNLWIVGGGSGHGFKLSPALGEFVADRVLGDAPVEPFFSLARLSDQEKSKTQFEQRNRDE